jgi:hypothetical protein
MIECYNTSCQYHSKDEPTCPELECVGATITRNEMVTLNALRGRGFAVVAFTPDELGDTDPVDVEERMIERGWGVIGEPE